MENIVEQPDQQLGFLLIQTSWLKQRINNSAFKDLDLTYIQFVVLAGVLELGATHSIVTQQTLVSQRRLDKGMLSSVVKTLIHKGYLQRGVHPSDRRAVALRLTPMGEKMAKEGKQMAKQIDEVFFQHVDRAWMKENLMNLLAKNNDFECWNCE